MNIPDHLLRSNHHFDIDYRLLCDIEQESKKYYFQEITHYQIMKVSFDKFLLTFKIWYDCLDILISV